MMKLQFWNFNIVHHYLWSHVWAPVLAFAAGP